MSVHRRVLVVGSLIFYLWWRCFLWLTCLIDLVILAFYQWEILLWLVLYRGLKGWLRVILVQMPLCLDYWDSVGILRVDVARGHIMQTWESWVLVVLHEFWMFIGYQSLSILELVIIHYLLWVQLWSQTLVLHILWQKVSHWVLHTVLVELTRIWISILLVWKDVSLLWKAPSHLTVPASIGI